MTRSKRSRALFIVVTVALLVPLTACRVFPDNVFWPNGRPVHPRMVMPQGVGITMADMQCGAGLTDQAYGTVEAWNEDPYFLNIEAWTWWFYDTVGHAPPTALDCVNSWNEHHDAMRIQYWCGNDLHDYYYNKNLDYISFFTQYFLCDAWGFAFWQCPGGCIGVFGATTSEPTDPLPPTRDINDPTDPNPPDPIVCRFDPIRICD